MERQVTPDDVKWVYRLLLGREPESYQMVMSIVGENIFQRELVVRVVTSDEFRLRFPGLFDT